MGLRYIVPFKDNRNTAYEVHIYRDGYTGEVKELTGAPSCFVVSGTDEDFMYTPVRTSTATLRVVDSELLTDLYSINNHYAPVKLYKNGVLEWTGYIKPEQFTQPYVAAVQDVSVECVGAMSTLGNIAYKKETDSGYISLWALLKKLIGEANGGYKGVYIPQVYGMTEAMEGNVLEKITVSEECFTDDEKKDMDVLESVCKVLNWTCYDIGGYVYLVDADWRGVYRLYDEALNNYTTAEGTELLLQDVGFNGAEANTLDIIPGYNKATVKSENKVFDEVIHNEEYEILDSFSGITFLENKEFIQKKFMKPKLWEIISYNSKKNVIDMDNPPTDANYDCYGAVEMRLAEYGAEKVDGTWVPNVDEYPWEDAIQMRYKSRDGETIIQASDALPVMRMKGANAVWAEGAISINASIRIELEYRMIGKLTFYDWDFEMLRCILRIGDWYWNGKEWMEGYTTFILPFVTKDNEWLPVKDTKTPDMPYKGIQGYVIPLPEKPITGQIELTMLSFDWADFFPLFDVYGVTMKGLSFDYTKKEGAKDEGENGDRVYENIVNEKYMSEAEEITFEIGSYNANGATYSKLLMNGDWLKDNLYSAVVGEYIRPEELMIRRIVNRYGETRIKLTEAIQMSGAVTPITHLKERTQPGKVFRMTSGEWDYEQNRLTIQMQEDVE